jgi:hypothetical protein
LKEFNRSLALKTKSNEFYVFNLTNDVELFELKLRIVSLALITLPRTNYKNMRLKGSGLSDPG